MKKVESILIKVIVIQFIFLFLSQLFFHQFNTGLELQQLRKYEGVDENTFSEILQTFQDRK